MNTSYLFKLKSHPHYLLRDHLVGSWEFASQLFQQTRPAFRHLDLEKLKTVVEVSSLLHDFGKATVSFQKYMSQLEAQVPNPSRSKKQRHSLISALTTFVVLRQLMADDDLYALLGFLAVVHHHRELENWDEAFTILDADWELVFQQLEEIDYAEMQAITAAHPWSVWLTAEFLKDHFNRLQEGSERISTIRRKLKPQLSPNHLEFYFACCYLFSLLLQADKQEAILHQKTPQLQATLTPADVYRYIQQTFAADEKHITHLRNRLRQLIEQTLQALPAEVRILSLNAPTGSGKTIASLYAALHLQRLRGHDHIIYCLPFTSIIDQNAEVFADIYRACNIEPDSRRLLKHHHLVEWHYRIADELDMPSYQDDQAIFLIEGWNSVLVVTTFVQFLYSLISRANSQLRKFHRFANAVILLDEVQTIPHAYWKLIHDMLAACADYLHSTIVLITATMPLIFSEQKGDIVELASEKQQLFQSLDRIDLDVSCLCREDGELVDTPMPEFVAQMHDLIAGHPQNSILIVANTIRSAKNIYEQLKEIPSHEIIYLSSHVIPKTRMERIQQIKDAEKQQKPILLISTQLVEAGVDIDFDIVVRDFAPLDSIFQVCGRCNRNHRHDFRGQVKLYHLIEEDGHKPCRIYDKFLLLKTCNVLAGKKIIPQRDFFALANDYFLQLAQGSSSKPSEQILEALAMLCFKDAFSENKFALIQEDHDFSVFVECDEQAENLWQQYRELSSMPRSFERNSRLRQLYPLLEKYIINVPRRCISKNFKGAIYRLNKDKWQQFYDLVTGFDREALLPETDENFIY